MTADLLQPSSAKPHAPTAHSFTFALLVATIFFFPSGLRYEYLLSSFAIGVGAVSALAILLSAIGFVTPPGKRLIPALLGAFVVAIFIGAHTTATFWLGQPDIVRPLTSLALLLLMMIAAPFLGAALFTVDDRYKKSIEAVAFASFPIALIGLAGIAPYSEIASDRPLFPFTEPSHYAFTVFPLWLYLVAIAGKMQRLILLAIMAGLALLLKSLSLAVAVLVLAVVTLQGGLLVCFLIISGVGLSLLDLTYFTDRLDFSYQNQNLSMLVYRQGWELILTSLSETRGWGIGFQRLGFTDLFTTSSNIIYALTGSDVNIADGGLTVAKVVVEFGVIGVLAMVYLSRLFFCAALQLRRIALRRDSTTAGEIFALCCLLGVVIEFFVRGAGYFTPTLLLAASALPYARSVIARAKNA